MSASSIPPEPSPGPAGAVPPPPVGVNPVPPPPTGTATQESTSGLPPNIAAAIACLLSIIGGIIFLVIEKRNAFVRFYAMQSLILGALSIAFSISLQIAIAILHLLPVVGTLLSILLGFCGMIVGLAFFVAWVLMIINAFAGKEWEVPYIGKMARAQLAKSALPPGTV